MDKIVKWLREEQERLQTEFMSKVAKQRKGNYEWRGVWISVTCSCMHDFPTPYFIRDNGQCPECGKKFYRADSKKQSKE